MSWEFMKFFWSHGSDEMGRLIENACEYLEGLTGKLTPNCVFQSCSYFTITIRDRAQSSKN